MHQKMSPIDALSGLLKNYFYAIVIAAAVAFGVRIYVVEAFKIPTDFMAPTLIPGDHIFANKLAYVSASRLRPGSKDERPVLDRGDVVIFSFPNDPRKEYIKRVIGIGGDVISIQDGGVVLNGKKIGEKQEAESAGELLVFEERLEGKTYKTQWLKNPTQDSMFTAPSMMAVTVPNGKVFVLGDFRSKGQDSRSWGFIDSSLIKARAAFIWFSIGDSIRWNRMFVGIH